MNWPSKQEKLVLACGMSASWCILVHVPSFFPKATINPSLVPWFEHLFPLQHSWCSKIFCMIFHMVFHMFSHDFPAFLWFSICFPMLFGSYLACGGEMRRSLVAVRLFIFGSFFDCRKWSFFYCREWVMFLRGRCSISRPARLWR